MTMAQGSPTTVAQNKASFRRIPERIYNDGDVALSSEVMTDDYIEHIPLPPGFPTGRAGFDQFVEMFRTAVPDLTYTVTHFTPDDLIGEGDHVVHHVEGRGTHLGALFGIAPTGRSLDWTETHIGRYADGMLVEHWGQIDVLRILQGVGTVPGYTPRGARPIAPAVEDGHPLSPDEMRGLMTRFVDDIWNDGRLEVADELFHPSATSPSAPDLPLGGAGVRLIAEMMRTAFPDFHMTIEDTIVEYPYVVGRFSETGTQTGPFMGLPLSGKHVAFGEIGILRVAGGQVVESWYDVDMLGLMGQLGVGG
jgi:predicted ester cyclase